MSGLFGNNKPSGISSRLASTDLRTATNFQNNSAYSGIFSGLMQRNKQTKNNTILGSTEELPFPVDPYSVAGRTAARKKATQAAATRKGYTSTILSQDMYK